MASVSVIIVNYNTFDLTCRCIESIYANEVNGSFEIILVDNNSTEVDPEEFKKKFSKIKLIKSSINAGFAKGNNLGITQASGEFILLLNSDTVLLNNAISICKQYLKDNIGIVTARLEYPNGNVQHNCQRFPSIRYKLFELFRLQKIFPSSKRKLFGSFFDYQTVAYPDWVWGTFFMFRKDLLLNLPKQRLNDIFFMYVEDMQWCIEFRRMGHKIAFLPNACVTHFMGGSGGEKNDLMKQNMETFMRMNYPGWKRLLIRTLNFFLTGVYGY